MFSTNLIQSNYGDLSIKTLAFDSFKERLESTMAALTFFISTGQCDCDEIAESNFNRMIAYMSNINYDASKPGAPALSFDTYLQDNVKYRVIINNLYGGEFRIRDINENFVGMDFTCEF
ncbi:protein [Escherichia coli]|nr:protein [Escherichia coli]